MSGSPGRSRRPERIDELALEGAQLAEHVVAEVGHVDGIAAVRRRPDHVPEALDEGVLAERGERHHLAFVAEAGKAEILGDERVDEAGGVDDAGRPRALEPVAPPDVRAARAVVAVAVHHQHERFLERRGKEHGRMGVVMRRR